MNRPTLRRLCVLACAMALAAGAQAGLLVQRPGDDYIAFEAEDYDGISSTGTTYWIDVDTTPTLVSPQGTDVLPADTNASGGAALLADFLITSHQSTVTYRINFDSTGSYRLYARYSMFDSAASPGAYGNEDSFYRPPDFDTAPLTGTSGEAYVVSGFSTANTEGVYGWKNTAASYTVDAADVAAGYVDFMLDNREQGLSIDRIVFSKQTGLSGAALDALWNHDVVVTHATGDGAWATAGNWDNGVPDAAKPALIGESHTITLATAGSTARALTIGHDGNVRPGDGTLTQSGGDLTITDFLHIGMNHTGAGDVTGTYTTTGGSLTVGTPATGRADLLVGYRPAADSSQHATGTLDLSGATQFHAYLDNFIIGERTTGGLLYGMAEGHVTLAATNTIDAKTILISESHMYGTVPESTLTLGTTNNIKADTLTVSGFRGVSVMQFGPGGGTLNLTGSSGAAADLKIANCWSGTNSSLRGHMDMTGGTLNATLDDVVIAYDATGPGGTGSVGTLTFEAGTITANSLTIGDAGTGLATGTINMKGGDFTVDGNATLGTGTDVSSGTIHMTGGDLDVKGSLTGGVGTSTVHVDDGTLDVGGDLTVDELRVGYLPSGVGHSRDATVTVAGGGTVTIGTPANPTPPDLYMGYNTAGDAYNAEGTLDLSDASTFTAYLDKLSLGEVTSSASTGKGAGTLKLAATNTIEANEILVSWSNMHAAVQLQSTVELGNANTIEADTLTVGGRRGRADMHFAAGGTLTLSGLSRPGADLRVAYTDLDTGSSCVATMDLTGGTFDATLRDVVVGYHMSKTGTDTGTLTFEAGTVAADTLTVGTAGVSSNGKGRTNGTVNMNGGTLTVANATEIGVGTGNATGTMNLGGGTFTTPSLTIGQGATHATYGDGTPTGTFHVSGGTAQVNGDVTLGTGTAASTGAIEMTDGAMNVTGGLTGGVGSSTVLVDGGTLDIGGDLKVDELRVGLNGRAASVTAGGDVVIGASGILDIGRRATAANDPTVGTLDLSDADSVELTLDELRISTLAVGNNSPTQGTLDLSDAGANTIKATTLTVGYSASGYSPAVHGVMHLKADNSIEADKVYVGRRKSRGDIDIAAGGTLTLTGLSGAEADLYIGYCDTTTTSDLCDGNVDLTGGTFNASLDELVIGYHQYPWDHGNNGYGRGELTFDKGTVTANTVTIGDGDIDPPNATYSDPAEGGGIGSLNIAGGSFTAGAITLGTGSSRTRGTVDFSGGTLAAASITHGVGAYDFDWTGGTLHVDTFGFDLEQKAPGGTLAPGRSIGHTLIDGDYDFLAGLIEIEMNGFDQGDLHDPLPSGGDGIGYDYVEVLGDATLDGIVQAVLTDGFTPGANHTFDVLTATTIALGDNFAVDLGRAGLPGPNEFLWRVIDGPDVDTLQLYTVPEPTTITLLALGAASLVVRRRRRRILR